MCPCRYLCWSKCTCTRTVCVCACETLSMSPCGQQGTPPTKKMENRTPAPSWRSFLRKGIIASIFDQSNLRPPPPMPLLPKMPASKYLEWAAGPLQSLGVGVPLAGVACVCGCDEEEEGLFGASEFEGVFAGPGNLSCRSAARARAAASCRSLSWRRSARAIAAPLSPLYSHAASCARCCANAPGSRTGCTGARCRALSCVPCAPRECTLARGVRAPVAVLGLLLEADDAFERAAVAPPRRAAS